MLFESIAQYVELIYEKGQQHIFPFFYNVHLKYKRTFKKCFLLTWPIGVSITHHN
jgi:hypothetical protein